jgi:hypothetical protein
MLVGSCSRCGSPTTLRCTFCGRTVCKNCLDADERLCPDCLALQKRQKGVANVRLPPSRQG